MGSSHNFTPNPTKNTKIFIPNLHIETIHKKSQIQHLRYRTYWQLPIKFNLSNIDNKLIKIR
jgi:hypothetical protein